MFTGAPRPIIRINDTITITKLHWDTDSLMTIRMAYLVWIVTLATTLIVPYNDAAISVNARERLLQFHGPVAGHRRHKRSSESLSEIFGLGEDELLEIQTEATTVHGYKQYKMTETFKGKNVFDTIVTMTTDGKTPLDAHGHFVQDIHKDCSRADVASLTKDELFNILIRYFKDENRTLDIGSRRIRHHFILDDESVARRVAILEYLIESKHVQKRPTGIIDIKTGEILRAWNNLATCRSYMKGRVFGGNYKIGKVKYGITPMCLDMKQRRGVCYLDNKHVKVVDMFNTESDDITETARFYCFRRYGDRINGGYSPALDALFHGTVVGKMFEDWFGTRPLNNGKIVLRVHYSHLFTNAFWNGRNCSFGDGVPGESYPFTSLDIIGHEVAHGLTEQNSGLMYIGEAGGINEAFSDITGEMAELYADTVDWRVGYAIKVKGSMRYLYNPGKDNESISHVSQYRDGMNIHDTSGIFNYVFYLLAYEYGLLPQEVYRVFLHANRIYWHSLTNFNSGACDVMMSAYDLGQPGEPFVRAFAEVGIEACDVDDHIVFLRPNVTETDVKVSSHVKPVFAFEVPVWGGDVFIQANSNNADIFVEVYHDRWAYVNDSTATVFHGYSPIKYSLPRYYTERRFLVRFSTDSPKPLNDVEILAGYSCLNNFYSHDNSLRGYYLWECFGLNVDDQQYRL